MKSISKSFFLFLALIIVSLNFQKSPLDKEKVVYKTDNLTIVQLSKNVYQHISFLNTESFGRVSCNGMIVKDGNETVIFDTPVDDKSSAELISWIKKDLHSKINAIVATHFHEDCVGGLKEFDKNKIPSYGNVMTVEFAKENGFNVPKNTFGNTFNLKVGKKYVLVNHFGEGHTKDNVVAYFPNENVLFGGCLIKETGASKGNLEDANVNAWSTTVENVKKTYPDAKIIIPGHGKTGGQELLDYTIKLFKAN